MPDESRVAQAITNANQIPNKSSLSTSVRQPFLCVSQAQVTNTPWPSSGRLGIDLDMPYIHAGLLTAISI
jgi:hypothetical protein